MTWKTDSSLVVARHCVVWVSPGSCTWKLTLCPTATSIDRVPCGTSRTGASSEGDGSGVDAAGAHPATAIAATISAVRLTAPDSGGRQVRCPPQTAEADHLVRVALPVMQHIPSFLGRIGERDDSPALVTDDTVLNYRQLAVRMDALGSRLGSGRRLVAVTLTNDLHAVTSYLAALEAGHVVLVLTPDRTEDVLRTFDPDTVVTSDGIEVRHKEPRHDLHPDLALVLSTSGSTGSPRLIRLSYENLDSNAAAIIDYQGLSAADRCITSLPLHYCYGMSVLHSHLMAGGATVLTDLSVVDGCFWDLAERTGVTTIAGVPHTFDLLDSAAMRRRVPRTVRLITQAGGALPTEHLQDLARWCDEAGRQFLVMYGQAEATARISYLPAHLAGSRAGCVGIPIPGGRVTIARPDADGVGELIYEGPNVMLGYAERPSDLALGRQTRTLATGDRAAITEDGLIRIVGRDSRRAKLFGLRLDLDRIDAALHAAGSSAHCAADDHRLVVAARQDDPVSDEDLVRAVADSSGLPPSSTVVVRLGALPRTPSGKPDFAAIALCGTMTVDEPPAGDQDVRHVVARTLRLDPTTIGPQDSFVSLGGDSLSYVLTAQRLSRHVDPLPVDWHLMPLGELQGDGADRSTWQRIETSVVVRALAVLAVVASHIGVIDVRGGAFILMALAGMSFARFTLATPDRRERMRNALSSWWRVLVPSVLWLVAVALLAEEYQWPVILGTNLFGPPGPAPEWRYWFVESLVYVVAGAVVLLAVPMAHRWERRNPWLFAMAVVGVGLVLRFTMLPGPGPQLASPATMLWFFAIGWALVMARGWVRRAMTLGALVVGLPGFFVAPSRGAIVFVALLVVVCLPMVRVPRWLGPPLSGVAAASLFLYLTHWQVFPPLQQWPWLALTASIAVGLIAHRTYEWSAAHLSRRMRRTPGQPQTPSTRTRQIERAAAAW